jgi:ribosome-interacting GTPase 1
MASTNQSPFYQRAEQDFHNAKNDEERITCLEIMIKECPKHKSSEAMLRNLTIRLKKLKEGVERQKKSGKSNKEGIKKAEMQCVLFGFPNCGKSTIFNTLTRNKSESKVSPHAYSTFSPFLGTFTYEDAQVQIIDDAPIPNHDKSLVNSTDVLLVVIDSLNQLKEIEQYLWKSRSEKIYLFNKTDLLDESSLRKLHATLSSKYSKLKVFLINKEITDTKLKEIKREIFNLFPIVRIYTKEPKKEASKEPMIMKKGSTLKDTAERILKGMSKIVKRARIWGPSSKFSGQVVGLEHVLKDKDVVEFTTE